MDKKITTNLERNWELEFGTLVLDYYMNCGSSGFAKSNPKYEKIVDFIQSLLSQQREEMREKIESMKKDTSVYKQSLVALKFRDQYSLVDVRNIVKGYNKALDDLLEQMEDKHEI